MPKLKVNGVNLYYEESGAGTPIVFLHEFAGDYRSWEPQMRFFARRYRCVTLSYRGYAPSDVPKDPDAYSQDIIVDDVLGLMDGLGIDRAHICGLSIGANTAVFLGLRAPERCLSLTVAGGGHGSVRDEKERAEFEHDFTSRAQRLLDEGMEPVARLQAEGPSRLPMKMKDPRGWAEFRDWFVAHDPVGSAHMAVGVPLKRPNYHSIADDLKTMDVPTLIIVGDQDAHCIEGSLFLKQALPRAGLSVFPMSGHLLPSEEPDLFNRTLLEFTTLAEAGRWVKP
jgi:pimeloyl-ACP methyl ester carboxylesterase